jgi:hypothetical protein
MASSVAQSSTSNGVGAGISATEAVLWLSQSRPCYKYPYARSAIGIYSISLTSNQRIWLEGIMMIVQFVIDRLSATKAKRFVLGHLSCW